MSSSSDYLGDRQAPRLSLCARAMLGGGGFLKVPVTVVDISARGCRIKTATRLSKGFGMSLKIGDLVSRFVKVVWSDGSHAGLEFHTPLEVKIVAEIVRMGGGEADEAPFLRRTSGR